MKRNNVFCMALWLTFLVLISAETQAFATIDTIRFGGIPPTGVGKNFKPSLLNLNVGDTILWMGFFGQADPFHRLQSVTIPSGAMPFGPVTTGTTFMYKVTVPGSYHYQCLNHCCSSTLGSMQGDFTAVQAEVKGSVLNSSASLEKNFPNPFAATTTIRYSLSYPSPVSLSVFDLNGKKLRTLINKSQNSGSYEVSFDGSGLPNGTYIYQLQVSDAVLTRQMILVKQE
jgi:plastocyanin